MDAVDTVGSTKELVLGALDALFAGDDDAFFARTTPDIRVIEPSYLPYGGTYVGRDGFAALGKGLRKVLDLRSIEVVSATSDQERTVLLMTASLRYRPEEQRYLTEHWVVTDGLISEIRVFWSGLGE